MLLSFEGRTIIMLTTVALGLFLSYVVSRASKNRRLIFSYLILNLSFILWSLTTYFSTVEYFYNSITILARAALVFSVVMLYTLVMVIFNLIYHRFPSGTLVKIWTIWCIAHIPVTASPLFFISAESVDGEVVTHTGPLMFLFGIFCFVNIALPVYFLVKGYRHNSGDIRKKILVLLIGYILMFAGLFGAILLPIISFNNAGVVPLGPLFVDVFFIAIAIVITRYEFFRAKILSAEVLAVALNLLLLLQVWLAFGSKLFGMSVFIFVFAFFLSILVIENLRRAMAGEIDKTRFQALQESDQKLRELDRAKNDFVVLAAHQLRTPVSVVSGYVELMKDGAYGKMPVQSSIVLDNIELNNHNLSNLIDEFLDIAEIEEGIMKFNFKNIDFVEIADKCVASLRENAAKKHINLKLVAAFNKKIIQADLTKIFQVVKCFLENAIEYSEKGDIIVEIKTEDNGVSFAVRDQGMGFRTIESDNLFHKFYRGSNASTANANGIGLGLYLAKHYIEGHHGRIWGNSSGIGKGSEFGFWVPSEQPQ